MERIVKVGQYIYLVSYSRDVEELPVIQGIEALSELILFEGVMPILYERLDSVRLADAEQLTVGMEGKTSLMYALIVALNSIPMSDPEMHSVYTNEIR